jgi:hypothetical protein
MSYSDDSRLRTRTVVNTHTPGYAGRLAKYLLIGLAIFIIADWCAFEVRLMRGSGLASQQVDQYLKTPLKGEKLEYDYLGSASENCARAVFPQYAASQWNPPCWWLARHSVSWK